MISFKSIAKICLVTIIISCKQTPKIENSKIVESHEIANNIQATKLEEQESKYYQINNVMN